MPVVVGVFESRDHRLSRADKVGQLLLGKMRLGPGVEDQLRDERVDGGLLHKLARVRVAADYVVENVDGIRRPADFPRRSGPRGASLEFCS